MNQKCIFAKEGSKEKIAKGFILRWNHVDVTFRKQRIMFCVASPTSKWTRSGRAMWKSTGQIWSGIKTEGRVGPNSGFYSRLHARKRLFELIGISGCPGTRTEKPKNMKVRTASCRSCRSLASTRTTWLHNSSSSAFSSRAILLWIPFRQGVEAPPSASHATLSVPWQTPDMLLSGSL